MAVPSELATQLAQWHTHYRQLGETTRIKKLEAKILGTIQQRKDQCQKTSQTLRSHFLDWLDSSEFRALSDELRDEFPKDESVQVFLQSDDPRLDDLPWHEWDFLLRRTHAAYVLSPPAFRKVIPPQPYRQQQQRILVILGKSDGINTRRDADLFQGLPGNPIVEVLPQTSSKDLLNTLWEKPWNMIVFAGHSETRLEDGKGIIHLNDAESLTIDELWLALRRAVDRGLQLVIFNSCDGLGIARQLDDDLAIPQMVVMKELVPDAIAHNFLHYLLHALTQENLPLHLAVREAQQRLQAQEQDYPCASWLPVLWQNPAAEPFVWTPPPPPPRPSSPRLPWRRVLATSLAVTCLVMGTRWLGWLQSAELAALDRFMQPSTNPSHLEPSDQRILLLEITESDIRNYGFPVPDGVLAQLLERLQRYQPEVIGLNIWRDTPQQPGNEALERQFRQNDRLIAVCQFPNVPQGQDEIPPPRGSTHDRVGFNNFITDELSGSRDDTIRRHLLSRTPNGDEGASRCNADYSFASHLAFQYLQAKGVEVAVQDNKFRVGNQTLLPLQSRSGGYQTIDARGYQILLNYRRAANIARSLTLTDALTSPLDPALVKGKIVMIGVTAESGKDYWKTPFLKKMSGLHLHAHAVSQILSVVEDQRPLMGWLSPWIDALLVWVCAMVGGSLVWLWHNAPLRLGVAVTLFTVTVYTLCRVGFAQGLWLPLVPLALALAGSTMGLAAYRMMQLLRSSDRSPHPPPQ